MDRVILQAVYSDFKIVKTRSVAQITLEIPIERADEFHAGFGFPMPGAETWVALARLDPHVVAEPAPTPAEHPRVKRASGPLLPSARAALLCKELAFQAWVTASDPRFVGEDGAAQFIRRKCGVDSRSDLNEDRNAQHILGVVETDFLAASGRMAERR